jgi:L-iditol 2-dehydrogenase
MSARTMRAARLLGARRLALASVPLPEPGPGEARVRVRACGICGSDLHLFEGGPLVPGVVPGHEIAGEIDALGPGVAGFAPGEPVAVEPLHACGRCDECRRGDDALCRDGAIHGLSRDGGFAEFLCVDARRLFRVPSGLDPRLAALAEPMAVVVHGLRRGALAPGERVLVLGAGTLGLLAVLAARALGAGEVLATARHAHQAALAARLGAARVLAEADAGAAALDALGRAKRIDLAVETVGGSADTLAPAAAALRPGGRVAVLGFFREPVRVHPAPMLLKELTLAFSYCYARPREGADFAEAIRLLDAGREALAPLLTHAEPLEGIERAFATARDKRSGALKVSVLPGA